MKKANRKKILFALAMSSATLLSACGGGSSEDQSSVPGGGETVSEKHRFTATETSDYLVKNGKSSYKILVPSTSDDQLLYAQSELTTLFKEATGVDLPVVTDDGNVSYSESATYLSLGQNNFWTTAALEADLSGFGRDGVRIMTKGKSVFLFGQTNYSTLYAVYDFLKLNFNFETYYNDRYTLDKNVKDVKLYNYDVVDIPDVSFRQKRGLLYPTASQNQMFPYRMRVTDDVGSLILPIYEGDNPNGAWSGNHNSFYYFPKNKYQAEHPKLYNSKGDQLCFTAHGDEKELEFMVDCAAEKIEQTLTWKPTAQYPSYTTAFLGMNDVPDLCDCETCNAVKEKHNNAISATVLLFMKKVGKKVNEWMDLPENAAYKRPLNYSFFAYQSAMTPPFKENDDGTFTYDSDIIPDEGVNIMPYVASMNFDYGRSFYSQANEEARKTLKAWGNFYPGTWAWSYGGFFNDYITFYDIYNFYNDYHEYLARYNYSFSFEQVKNDQRGADPGFGGLANYVLCKKAWDSSSDMDQMINDYINNVYENAAPAMRELFEKLRLWFAKTIEKFGIGNGGSMQGDISGNKKYWGYGLVQELFDICDKAYDSLNVYAKDAAKYKRLKAYIDIEWLIPAKVAISCYEDKFTTSEFIAIKKKFKDICLDQGIKDIREFVSIQSYLESLGV